MEIDGLIFSGFILAVIVLTYIVVDYLKISTLESKIVKFEKQIATLKEENKKVKDLKAKLEEYQSDKEDADKDYLELKQRYDVLNKKYSVLQQSNTTKEYAVGLAKQLAEAKRQYKEMLSKYNISSSSISEMKQQISKLTADLTEAQNQNRSLVTKDTLIRKLQDEKSTLENQIANVTSERDEKTTAVNKLKEQISGLKDSLSQKTAEVLAERKKTIDEVVSDRCKGDVSCINKEMLRHTNKLLDKSEKEIIDTIINISSESEHGTMSAMLRSIITFLRGLEKPYEKIKMQILTVDGTRAQAIMDEFCRKSYAGAIIHKYLKLVNSMDKAKNHAFGNDSPSLQSLNNDEERMLFEMFKMIGNDGTMGFISIVDSIHKTIDGLNKTFCNGALYKGEDAHKDAQVLMNMVDAHVKIVRKNIIMLMYQSERKMKKFTKAGNIKWMHKYKSLGNTETLDLRWYEGGDRYASVHVNEGFTGNDMRFTQGGVKLFSYNRAYTKALAKRGVCDKNNFDIPCALPEFRSFKLNHITGYIALVSPQFQSMPGYTHPMDIYKITKYNISFPSIGDLFKKISEGVDIVRIKPNDAEYIAVAQKIVPAMRPKRTPEDIDLYDVYLYVNQFASAEPNAEAFKVLDNFNVETPIPINTPIDLVAGHENMVEGYRKIILPNSRANFRGIYVIVYQSRNAPVAGYLKDVAIDHMAFHELRENLKDNPLDKLISSGLRVVSEMMPNNNAPGTGEYAEINKRNKIYALMVEQIPNLGFINQIDGFVLRIVIPSVAVANAIDDPNMDAYSADFLHILNTNIKPPMPNEHLGRFIHNVLSIEPDEPTLVEPVPINQGPTGPTNIAYAEPVPINQGPTGPTNSAYAEPIPEGFFGGMSASEMRFLH